MGDVRRPSEEREESQIVKKVFKPFMLASVVALGVAASSASAVNVTINFENDVSGSVPNGFMSVDSDLVSIFEALAPKAVIDWLNGRAISGWGFHLATLQECSADGASSGCRTIAGAVTVHSSESPHFVCLGG